MAACVGMLTHAHQRPTKFLQGLPEGFIAGYKQSSISHGSFAACEGLAAMPVILAAVLKLLMLCAAQAHVAAAVWG